MQIAYKQQQQLTLLPISFMQFSLTVFKINNTQHSDVKTVVLHNSSHHKWSDSELKCKRVFPTHTTPSSGKDVLYCRAAEENVRLYVSYMKNVCIRFDNNSLKNVKHITINARNSNVTLINNVDLVNTNVRVVSHKSVINCNNTINVNKLVYDNALSTYEDNIFNIQALCSNELVMKIGSNDHVKCNITKLSGNSVIEFPCINNISLK